MRIEILYFDGCPSHERLVLDLRETLDQHGVEGQIALRPVETPEEAEERRFLGSPTVLVDGQDVDPTAVGRTDFGLKCRLYRAPDGGQQGMPPGEWITNAIERSRNG